ncbi:hypothetical protein D6T63_17525 [Arthrobacter cheniae]|uniref:Pyruvate, water dikinase n=1 Tax=Arthrobacter cheniae TaxID=1258888 RepID=A0A3A5LZ57_9MICC|nr:PEP/pyruvate-binding domain-containing protein [Arthrobacter cheniae]RJT75623.1 hypothetical protein D6T63_17525 [Arthrobacter cheniae]
MLVPLTDADEQCGAKAANLAHLLRAGFDVPPGFVVLDVLSGDSWVHELRAALRDTGAASVAVRSSALGEDGSEASFAGQLRSTLDLTEPAQVIDQVRRAARSGVSPEAVAYAARMGQEPAMVVPVIVQALVPAEVAGVMFTRHPVTGSHEVVIEAGRGLGKDVADGTVTPWAWVVDGHTITRQAITRQASDLCPPLTDRQVRQLAALGLRIQAVFGCPQDIEWAIADGTTWVLQSRPITASPIATTPDTAQRDGRAVGRVVATGTPASPGTAEGFVRIVHGFDDFARFEAGEVLVCRTTSPAWTPLLARAAAVVTEIGGLLAHAAIVAREFGIPAVLAAEKAMGALTDGQHVVIDGTAGTVTTTPSIRRAMNHTSPPNVRVLHAVRTQGYADLARISAHVRQPEGEVNEYLLSAEAHGWIAYTSYAGDGGWSLTEAGKDHGERLLAAELDAVGARAAVEAVHEDFLSLNAVVATACSAWQLAELGIGAHHPTLSDTIRTLEGPAAALAGIEDRLTSHLERFAGYHHRFTAALALAGADAAWITGTDRDSCHRVWFELHEDLIATLGLTRDGR